MLQEKVKLRHAIDMSLRLWSDHIPLERFASKLGYDVKYLYVKGEPMAQAGYLAGRLADRHYASVAHENGRHVADIVDWARGAIAAIDSDGALVDLLREGKIEALLWVALFGREPVPMPTLDASLVRAVARLGARIFLENYTDRGPDCPTKIWLPAL